MPLRARVKNGRLLLDEPTELPDGTEVNLAVLDDDLGLESANHGCSMGSVVERPLWPPCLTSHPNGAGESV